MDFLSKIKSAGIIVKENEPLAPYTTFYLGGPARYLALVNSEEQIKLAVGLAVKNKIPLFILGGGSNLLISDAGFAGLVIKINLSFWKIKGQIMECGAGLPLSKAMGRSLGSGLLGLEWAAGIPGTIGGSIAGNAGAYGGEISQSVTSVRVLRQGKIKVMENKDCDFSYRSSVFKKVDNQSVIMAAILKLRQADNLAETILAKEKIRKIIKERDKKFFSASAGSVFKNVVMTAAEAARFKEKFCQLPDECVNYQKIPAAWLIEQCGLKGKSLGGAMVSPNHAGIIVNNGGAMAADVKSLIELIKREVKSKFDLELEEEIREVGYNF